MKLNKITNPIYFELIKLNLIKKTNIVKISNKCRDKKISVYQDKKTKVIFLEKYYFKKKKYLNYKNKYKTINGKIYKKIDINKKEFIQKLNDDNRRVLQFKKIIKNKEILDFGCGWGNFITKIKKAKDRYAFEIREECIKFLKRKKIKLIKNIENDKKKFDVITMFHVLEHLPNQIDTLKQLKKLLKPKGNIIIEIPHANDFLISKCNLKSFKDFTFISEHLVLHTENSIYKLLKFCGYRNITINFYQRHDLNNHIHWLVSDMPNGHNFLKIANKNLRTKYENLLKKNKITDTLIVSAKI